MPLYIMKPWYKTAGGKTTSTTYSTMSLFDTGIMYMNNSSAFTKMKEICPSYSSSKSYINGYTYYSHTITLPKLNYSDINTNGTLYNKYSTNQSVICRTYSDIVTSTLIQSSSRSGLTTTSSKTFLAGFVSGNPIISNSNYFYCDYSTSSSNLSKNAPSYICNRALPYSFDILPLTVTSRYNLVSNYMRVITRSNATWQSLVYKHRVVYHEKSDPTKVTIIFDDGGAPLNGDNITIYKATLSEVPLR